MRRLDENVCDQKYSGNCMPDNPEVTETLQNDYQDALDFPMQRKWTIVIFQSLSMLVETCASSAYASDIESVRRHLDVSEEVATLSLSPFLLAFALDR